MRKEKRKGTGSLINGQETTKQNEKGVEVTKIGIKKFPKKLRKKHMVEVYLVCIRKLKDNGEEPEEEAFGKQWDEQKEQSYIQHIIQKHRDVFRGELPKGIPPKRDIDHRV